MYWLIILEMFVGKKVDIHLHDDSKWLALPMKLNYDSDEVRYDVRLITDYSGNKLPGTTITLSEDEIALVNYPSQDMRNSDGKILLTLPMGDIVITAPNCTAFADCRAGKASSPYTDMCINIHLEIVKLMEPNSEDEKIFVQFIPRLVFEREASPDEYDFGFVWQRDDILVAMATYNSLVISEKVKESLKVPWPELYPDQIEKQLVGFNFSGIEYDFSYVDINKPFRSTIGIAYGKIDPTIDYSENEYRIYCDALYCDA